MADPETVEIRLLGQPEVLVDGSHVEFDTRKALGILGYLVVEGGAWRETLCGLFWPDSPAERARATLRRTLSAIRRGIGPAALVADRDRVSLFGVTSDVSEFQSALDEVSAHEHDDTEVCRRCIAPLDRAVRLYRDSFLRGFSVGRAPLFEEWERATSAELHRAVSSVFGRLATARASEGRYSEAIESVSRWIELDPLHEPAHRLAMLLYAWSGDRPGAIEAYTGLVRLLDRELAVSPLEETTELYDAILDEDLPPAPGPRRRIRSVAPAASRRPDDIIDRIDEWNRIEQLLASTTETGGIACLAGGSWMGKTRLLQEVTGRTEGRFVLSAKAYRIERDLPYGVMAQILSQASTEGIPDAVPEWALGELRRILPNSTQHSENESDPYGGIRLREGVCEVLSALAGVRPVVILVDDLQWADDASMALLAYLATRMRHRPILILSALRSDGQLSETAQELKSLGETIVLTPLTADDIVDLTATPDEIIGATNGVPLLVAEYLAGRTDSTAVDEYLSQRMDALSDLGTQLLGAAAVLTGSSDLELLQSVSGRSEDEVVDAVDELTVAGLLEQRQEIGEIGFTLDAASERVYGSMSIARRRLLHRRAARALEARARSRLDARTAALVASHLERAGEPDAAAWYEMAGHLAKQAYANAEAVALYRSALALGSNTPAEVHLSLGELAMAEGRYRDAMESLMVAGGQAVGETAGVVHHRAGQLYRLLGSFDLAEEHLRSAVETHPVPGLVYADWAMLADRSGDAARALELADRALRHLAGSSDPTARSRVHSVLGAVSPDRTAALEHLDAAIRLAADDDLALMAALNNKARLLADSGDHEAALEPAQRAVDLAVKTGRRHHEAALRDLLADVHHRSGSRELAAAAQTEAVTMFAEIATGELEPELWLLSRW